ncbi:MAG: hypothetical protein SNJ60_01630 [Pseudanabaenaceae cyanobacterium]
MMKVLGTQHNGFWGDRPGWLGRKHWGVGLLGGAIALGLGTPVAATPPPPRPGDAARLGGSLGVTVRPVPPPLSREIPPTAWTSPQPTLGRGPQPLDPAARLPGTFVTDPVPAVPLVWDTGRETRTLTD